MYDHMRKETILKQFCDLQKIKYRESINQFYIVIDRKQYTAKTRRELIDKLFEKYCGDAVTTLEQAYLEWMHWRASINTSSKTLKENKNEWKHYIQDSQLAKMQVAKIEIVDFEAFLYDVTMDFAITSKRLSNILSVDRFLPPAAEQSDHLADGVVQVDPPVLVRPAVLPGQLRPAQDKGIQHLRFVAQGLECGCFKKEIGEPGETERLFRLVNINRVCHSVFCGRSEARFPGRMINDTSRPG